MAEQIKVDCDYETTTAKIYRGLAHIANYQVKRVDESAGYTRFKINNVSLGELGFIEVKKDGEACQVIFSNLSVIDNYDEWLKQAMEQVNQMPENGEDKILRLGQMQAEKMKVDPEFHKAKQEAWKDTIDVYKEMIDKLRSRTILTFQQIDTLIVKNLDSLDPRKYEVNREDRGQTILYAVSIKSGELVGRYRIEKHSDGSVAYGSIQGDSPEWGLIWECMLNRTIEREVGTMTEAKEEAYQRRQESYLKQIQGNREAVINLPFVTAKDELEKYLWENGLGLKYTFKPYKIELPEGQAYDISHSDYGGIGQLSIHPRENQTRIRFAKSVIPLQEDAIGAYIKAGNDVPQKLFDAVDWLFQQREKENAIFYEEIQKHLDKISPKQKAVQVGAAKPKNNSKIFLANKALWKEIGFFYRSSEYKTAKQGIEHMQKKHPKFKKSEKTMNKIIKAGLSGEYD